MLGLKFNGTWRNYQKQVLDNFQEYQADGHCRYQNEGRLIKRAINSIPMVVYQNLVLPPSGHDHSALVFLEVIQDLFW